MAFLDEIKKNVTEFTETVVKKSNTMIESQKLKMKKSSLENDVKDMYVFLGRLYEKKIVSGETEDIQAVEAVDKIAGYRAEMEQLQAALRKLKGVVRCTGCGADVDGESDFCPKCGIKIEKAAADEIVDPEDVTVEEAAEKEEQKTLQQGEHKDED